MIEWAIHRLKVFLPEATSFLGDSSCGFFNPWRSGMPVKTRREQPPHHRRMIAAS
jgi:hypothetical protein